MKRVVVTGTSVVSPLGCDVEGYWERICGGQSGIGPLTRFDATGYKARIAGEVRDFEPTVCSGLDEKQLKRLDRFCQFALVGAHKAITQAGVDFEDEDPTRCGVVIGSGVGGLSETEEQHTRLRDGGPDRVSPLLIPKLMINSATGNISVHWGLQGPNSAVATACSSATHAIGDACRHIQHGAADVMIAGGSEASLTPMGIAGFSRMKALSTRNEDPQRASRPFDKDRDGFVMSEGAGIVVLEEWEHARRRGAPILAELVGYGISADAAHITAPDPRGGGAALAMDAALRDARVDPGDIDYVNAHGTSTPLGDRAESEAIRHVFGSDADKLVVSSTKSQIGHLLGASGGVEFVTCVLALRDQVAPPNLNLETRDPACNLDYVGDVARPLRLRHVLKNSFAFGGNNACLILRKPW